MTTTPRHFGTIRGGEEVIIAGYNKGTNSCIVVRIKSLPQDEAASLRQIAQSVTAQNLDYLIPTIRVELHKSGQDWFTHLITRMYRNDGAVINLPMKEIETMNEQQKAYFKGYGAAVEPNGGPSGRVGSEQEFTTPLVNSADEIVVSQPIQETAAPVNLQQAQMAGVMPKSPTPATDPEMARVAAQAQGPDPMAAMMSAITSLAESQAKMAVSLDKLSKQRAPKKPAPRKKTTSVNNEVTATTPDISELNFVAGLQEQ
jgi:hypothetical protein